MKAIGIVGSPRKQSNTDLLVEAVLAGIAAEGAETEKIYLTDLTIRPCEACGACRDCGVCVDLDLHKQLYII
jgi:multimeric flavodoxin WrbA